MNGSEIANVIAAVSAVATLGSVIIAAYALQRQQRQARELHEVALILKLEERFDATTIRQARARAASFLTTAGRFTPSRYNEWGAVAEVLDFFQTVGLFQRYGHVRPELTHSWFSHWWEHYYAACREYINFTKEASPGTWEDAITLHSTFLDIDRAKGWTIEITAKTLQEFYIEEIATNVEESPPPRVDA